VVTVAEEAAAANGFREGNGWNPVEFAFLFDLTGKGTEMTKV
jgi:hypothetical protein